MVQKKLCFVENIARYMNLFETKDKFSNACSKDSRDYGGNSYKTRKGHLLTYGLSEMLIRTLDFSFLLLNLKGFELRSSR